MFLLKISFKHVYLKNISISIKKSKNEAKMKI